MSTALRWKQLGLEHVGRLGFEFGKHRLKILQRYALLALLQTEEACAGQAGFQRELGIAHLTPLTTEKRTKLPVKGLLHPKRLNEKSLLLRNV